MVLALVQNIAILVALSVVTQAVTASLPPGSKRRAIILGLLFGGTAVLGMMTPFRAAQGVIYDGRSIILGIAGIFGGPAAAAVAAIIAAAYRLHLGGAGAWVGVAVIAEATAFGVAFHYHRQKTGHVLWRELLLVGIAIHVAMLLLQLVLPGGRGPEIVARIALPVLTVYPIGMMLVARLMLDQEERHRREAQLRELNASLERMVDERTEELQAANEELEQTNEELTRALAEIEAANRSKSAFVRAMSHELRTPLNSVIGFADLLASGLPGPLNEEQLKQVRMIGEAGRHLLALVNQVLDLARIEAGHLDLSFEDLDARDLVSQAVETLRPQADAKGLALESVLPPEPVLLRSDRTRVLEILINLVGNAVKFTDAGEVRLTLETRDGVVSFVVSDTGPGIDPEDADHVFREFTQGSRSGRRQAVPGAGLGLAISRQLAEALGGVIELESEPGHGATFTLRLPVQPQETMTAPA